MCSRPSYEDQSTKHGKAAHCRSDCPFLLKCHVIQSQSWHFHCDPNDAFGKARSEAAHRVMRTSFDPQSVLETFPVSQILVPDLYTRLPCCSHPDDDSLSQRDTCDRSMSKGSDGHQSLFSYLVVLVSVARRCRSPWNLACSESSSQISGFLTWCHRAQHISLLICAENDLDETSGGGTGRLWWTAVVHVHCGVDEQLVSKDTRRKRKLLKRCCSCVRVFVFLRLSFLLCFSSLCCSLNFYVVFFFS